MLNDIEIRKLKKRLSKLRLDNLKSERDPDWFSKRKVTPFAPGTFGGDYPNMTQPPGDDNTW